MGIKRTLSLELKSTPSSISLLEPYVQRVVSHYHFCDEAKGKLLVVLTEAVTNAIVHGNASVEDKTVKVKLVDNSGDIRFIVEDEGCGFDPEQVPDPTMPENLLKPGGRGVFLIRELSDGVCYHKQGRQVEITFEVSNCRK
jgi:serine/threonine-protein kinase RsbW